MQDTEGKKYYWLHSLILTVLTGFGGGMIAPMMIGKPPLFFQNELILPFCLLFWYVCSTIPRAQAMLTSTPGKIVWGTLNGLFRTHAVCNIVRTANEVLPVGPYYPHALMGPIFAGVFLGACGQFLPFDKGLAPVVGNGTPWPIQAAFLTSVFYHLECFDKSGFLGVGFRSIFGTYDDSSVRVIIATVQIATTLAQVLFNESANFFTPFHKFLYLVFQVTGPTRQDQSRNKTVGWDVNTRYAMEHCIEIGRVFVVVAVIMTHIYITYPSSTLVPGMRLGVGSHIGSCQMPLSACQPSTLSLYSTDKGFKLSSYAGKSSATPPSQSVWSVDIPAQLKVGETASAILGEDGVMRVVASTPGSQTERQLWASKSKCGVSNSNSGSKVKLQMTQSGVPTVACAGGDTVTLA